MASFVSTSLVASPAFAVHTTPKIQISSVSMISGAQRFVSFKSEKRSLPFSRCFISCSSLAQPETLKIVQATIANQLSIDECTVAPSTKFVDLGADSLDTVEIMMALEETFGVSIGESGAENIATVQDAANLIEKVKAEA